MTQETLDQLARELASQLPLPAEDWEAIRFQARRMLETVQTLHDLPLESVEPAFLDRTTL